MQTRYIICVFVATLLLSVLCLSADNTASDKYDIFNDLADKLSTTEESTFETMSDANPGCLFVERFETSMFGCYPKEKNILFSIDISASMNELAFLSPVQRRIDLVVLTIYNSLLEMEKAKTNQFVQIQLFHALVDITTTSKIATFGPVMINGDSSVKLIYNWLKQHTGYESVEGQTDLKFGLKSALTATKSYSRNETAIYLMSDGFENVGHVLKILPSYDPTQSPVVNTILFLKKSDEMVVKIMTTIAKYFGGYFKWSY